MTGTGPTASGSAAAQVPTSRTDGLAGGLQDAQPDPDAIVKAVLAEPDVVKLHSGAFGEVATYLPGRRVAGVQVGEQRVSVHVTVQLGSPVQPVARRVRAAVEPLAGGRPVDVVVEDVVDPAETRSEGSDGHGGDDGIELDK